MAKVEQSPETNTKKSNKKRKHNKDVTSDTAESPSGKFKKIGQWHITHLKTHF